MAHPPQPISWGSISQGMPVFSTNRMPVSAARSGTRGLPPLGLGGSSGSSGSATPHSSSVTGGLAMVRIVPDRRVLLGALSYRKEAHVRVRLPESRIQEAGFPRRRFVGDTILPVSSTKRLAVAFPAR